MKTARRLPPNPPRSLLRDALRLPLRTLLVIALGFAGPRMLHAEFVYETTTEFLTSGDFNGDGIPDALVLDKATGNARLAQDNGSGVLTWAGPFASGVENVTGCAVGRFLTTGRDALAVTAAEFNRIRLLDLSSATPPAPTTIAPPGVGPYGLVALRAPFGTVLSYHSLLALGSASSSNGNRADLLNLNAGTATAVGGFDPGGRVERPNAIEFNPAVATHGIGMLRGATDTLQLWRSAGGGQAWLNRPGLPAGSDYVFGRFLGETLPRMVTYQPGGQSLVVTAMGGTPADPFFGESQTFSFASPIQRVFYVSLSGAGILVIHFSDGVRGARLPAGGGDAVEFIQNFAPAGSAAATGFVPLGDGRFALLSGPEADGGTARAQVFQWNGTQFNEVSSSQLPEVTSGRTRATAWFFGAEPFVNRDPNFLFSVAVPDWTIALFGLPTSLTIQRLSDGGVSTGLGGGGGSNTNLPGQGAAFGIPNQYHPAISLYSYSSARDLDPVRVRISPPPGEYAGPVNIQITTGNAFVEVASYRLGDDAYRLFQGSFAISNDVTITYYATNFVNGMRSRLNTARYTFGRPVAPPPISDPTVTSNLPPVVVPSGSNLVALSVHGTVFYGRRSPNNVGTIWAINLDGSNDRLITSGARPRMSPDGRFLAFLRENNPFNSQGNLWVRDMLTGQERRVVQNTEFIIGFNWNIDSRTLYFDNACALWRVNAIDGSIAPLPMANDCFDDCPAVHPADGRIAFHSLNSNPAIRGLYVTPPGGGVRQRLPINGLVATWPAWSPDGQQIAFVDSLINGVISFGPDLFVVNPDGTGLHQITSLGGGNGFLTGAQWTSRSDALVAAGFIFNNNGLWVIPLTPDRTACASTPIRLPTTPGDDIDFAGTILTAPDLPELSIRRDPGHVVIFWRKPLLNFVLESSNALGSGAVWTPVTGPYPVSGFFHEVHLPEAQLAPMSFFRLRLP
jgi:hypothetical protein